MSRGNRAVTDRNFSFAAWIFLLVLVSIFAKWRLDPVPPVAADTSSRFSAIRAAKLLSGILSPETPHPVDSEANAGVRNRIISALSEAGYKAQVQDTFSCRDTHVYICARVKNIVALHEGARGGKLILLSAHYDSVGAGPGASDDGSGVAVLLEVARLLNESQQSKDGVLFLFTEGEEVGLLGAQAFATQNPWAKKVALAVNIEARGTSGQSALFETGSISGWLVNAFADTARRPLTNSLISSIYSLLPNDTDLTVFKSNGIQGLNFAYGEHLGYYHTPHDNLQSLSRGSLQQQGDNVYDLVRALVNEDIPADGAMGSLVYTDILGLGTIRWPAGLSLYISVLLLLMFVPIGWRLSKALSFTRSSVAKGFFAVPLCLVLGGTAAFLLISALGWINGSGDAWHSNELANRFLLWSSILLVVLLSLRLLGLKANPLGIWIGVGYAWLLLGLISSVDLPGISYMFILPSLILVVSGLFIMVMPRVSGWLSTPLLLLPALSALIVILPTVFLVEVMLGFDATMGVLAMSLFIALVATFAAPFVLTGLPPGRLRHPVFAALLIIIAGAAVSILAPRYSDDQPRALNIEYVQETTGDAYFLSSSSSPPDSVARTLGANASVRRVFPQYSRYSLAASTASANLPPARLTVLGEKQTPLGQELVVRIDADASLRSIRIFFPKDMQLSSIESEGQTMDYSGSRSEIGNYKVFTCQGDSCNERQLTLLIGNRSVHPVLIEESLPLAKTAWKLVAARNAVALPHQDGDQSFVMSEAKL